MGDKRDDQKVQKLPIVWFNSVKPTEPIRWLVHLLISMGEFDCEVAFWAVVIWCRILRVLDYCAQALPIEGRMWFR